MKKVTLKRIGKVKLNSYHPLCSTLLGVIAIRNHQFPPFIDGSCRREPDFQNDYPSISSLCRKGKFAPHLKKDEIIVYMTVGKKYSPFKKGHHLVAILRINRIFKDHKDGFNWYSKEKLQIPSNCMVRSNLPYSFDQTLGNLSTLKKQRRYLSFNRQRQIQFGMSQIRNWDNDYWGIATKWPVFVKTTKIYLNLYNPPLIKIKDFNRIFKKIPNTQTPNTITQKQLYKIGELVDIDFKFR